MSSKLDADLLRGRTLVLVAGVFLSSGGPLIRLVDTATEWQFLFYRAAAVLLSVTALIAWRTRGRVISALIGTGGPGAVAGCGLAVAFSGFVFAVTHTTIANALFMLSAAPFLSALLGRLVLGEPVRPATAAAIAGAVAGIGIMIGEGVAEGDLFGDMAALLAATGYAVFTVALRKGRQVDMLPAVALAGVISGLVAAVMAVLAGTGLAVSWHDFGLASTYGVLGVGAGLVLITLGSRHVPAAEITLLSMTEVVLGPLWGWLWFAEHPSTATLAGGAVLLTAVAGLALHGLHHGAGARSPPSRSPGT